MGHFFLTLINGGGPLRIIWCLKAKCDGALSNFAFSFILRRYTKGLAYLLSHYCGAGHNNRSLF